MEPFDIKRPWGNYRQFTHNSPSTVKIISVNPDEKLSLQSHQKRSEFWRVIDGSGVVEIDGVRGNVSAGDEREIKTGSKHRLEAGPDGIKILEIATGEFDENDEVRYEDKYGRR